MERPPAEPPPVDDISTASDDSLPLECLSHLFDEQAPTRWLDNRCQTPPMLTHLGSPAQINRVSISHITGTDTVHELWPGHDWLDRDFRHDFDGRISPSSVRDFPHLDCVGDGSSSLATSLRDVPPEDPAADFDFPHEYPCVERTVCDIRTIGIDGDRACFTISDAPPPLSGDTSDDDDVSLADTGANTCMKRTEAGLEDCHDISPVTVSLALTSDDASLT